MDITTEVIPSTWSVKLTATGYTGVVTWFRSTNKDVVVGVGAQVVDRGGPLNVPLQYYAVDDTDLVVAELVTIPATRPVLASAMYSAALPVTVISYRPYRGFGQSSWHPVIGRPDPMVSVFPATYPAGDLVLYVGRNDDRLAVIDLLQAGDPLLLRSTEPERLDDMTFLMTEWGDPFHDKDTRGGPSRIEIKFQRVTEVSMAWTPPPRTYADVLAEADTYAGLWAMYPTYQALLDGLVP